MSDVPSSSIARRALAGLTVLAFVAVLFLVAGPVRAQAIEIRIDDGVATGDPGSNVGLGSTSVSPDLRGRSCRASVTVTNGSSEHPGNRLVVASGGSTLVIDGIEEAAGAVTTSGGTLTLGQSIDVSVVLGQTGATSLGLVLTCEPIPDPTTTTARRTTTTAPPGTSPTTTPPGTTSTTKRDKDTIEASCNPDPVVKGDEVTISGGRTDGFGFRGGSEFEVRDGIDGDVLASGTVEANGLFEASFVVDLEPGSRTFEINSLGARTMVICDVLPEVIPEISVAPTSGTVCSLVTVNGTNYLQGDRVSVLIGDAPLGEEVLVDSSGAFEVVASLPDTGPGPFPISARRGTEPEADSVDFEVTEGSPTIEVAPTEGEPGAPIEITGAGFAPGDRPEITLGGAPFPGPIEVGSDGGFAVPATVPEIEGGSYPVEVAGGCAAASPVAFEVIVDPPVPVIAVDPGNGETGDEATVTGERYEAGDLVDITFDGVTFATEVLVEDNGTFSRVGEVPDGIDPGQIEVAAARGRAPEASNVPFAVDPPSNGCWWKLFGICWYWWLLILFLLLLFLWFLLWLWCRRRYPFCPGEEIPGSGWIACEDECDCRYRQGRCVSDGGDCPDGCSCELFRRKVWRSGGCWERVPERKERFTWCYRCACARPVEASSELVDEAEESAPAAEATEPEATEN